MDYIFGTVNINGTEYENLKTVGDFHTDLTGFCTIHRNYSDSIITDTFKVIKKYKSDTNGEKMFDWYTIEQHSRYIDRFTPHEEEINNSITDLEELVVDMQYDEIIEEV